MVVPAVSCQMVEFHRFGRPQMILLPENRYIRTSGWDRVAQELSPSLDQEALLLDLNALRYDGAAAAGEAQDARTRLADEAARFLDAIDPADGALRQVDLVTNAAELWAFPFEACFARRPEWLTAPDRGVVLTRRIRGDFSDRAGAWPAVPRVLFVHAPVTRDLEAPLVEAHLRAVTDALAPWMTGNRKKDDALLAVREVTSASHLARWRDELKPAFVHLLAHGAQAPRNPRLPQREVWGVRLGYEGEPGTPPVEIAEALRPTDGFPLVVTLAACDSANQASPAFAVQSVAQELHRCGVPVVIGSQLPLTKPGSQTLARAFYRRLLQGDDVRVALHAARVALHEDVAAGHDWLSLVGYVRLPPEEYGAHLEEVGLRMELRMLDAAQQRADPLIAGGGPPAEFAAIEALVQQRLASLRDRRRRLQNTAMLLEECSGLEASACKRLAELRFVRGLHYDAGRAGDWQASRDALNESHAAYRTAYEANLHSHWLGVQQLALEAVLTGSVARPADWPMVERAAQIAGDAAARKGKEDYWSCGTLMELALIGPRAARGRDLERAKAEAARMVERARKAGDEFAVASTRRQVERYVRWWIKDHGFFSAAGDLSADARELLGILS
jgi:hypothetical protein